MERQAILMYREIFSIVSVFRNTIDINDIIADERIDKPRQLLLELAISSKHLCGGWCNAVM